MNLASTTRSFFLLALVIPTLVLTACQTISNSNRTAPVANANFGSFAQNPTLAPQASLASLASQASLVPLAILIPQWHLSPQTDTKQKSIKNPQDENQFAIYSQVSEWIDQQNLSTVIVEGCEGEIKSGFATRYNGWTLADLEQLAPSALAAVDTQVGIKLKARYKDGVQIICGDDLNLIKQNQLTLSDLRGLLGFKIRIENAGNDAKKRQGYLSAARDVLKILADVSDEQVLVKIDQEIKTKLDDFEKVIRQRNEVFARTVAKFRGARPLAVVIGAIHIDNLKKLIPNAVVYQPRGLRGDEAEIIHQARDLLERSKNL